VSSNTTPPGATPSNAAPSPSGKWRNIVIALCAWALSTSLVFLLALRHAKVVSRDHEVASDALAYLQAASPPDDSPFAPREGPAAANSITDVNAVLTRVTQWKPRVARDKPSAGDRDAALEILPDDHCLGTHKAQVTLMLFGDLYCPFTRRVLGLLRQWLDEQPSAFRLVWRERPLDIHPNAPKAASIAERLALRSGEPAFWRFVVAVSELNESPSDIDLEALEVGLTTGKAKADAKTADAKAAAKIERDRLTALAYAIHATPTLFVNGLRIEGEISRPHLQQIIDEEKEEVETLLDDAEPAGKIYSIRVDANLLDWVRE
jgi:protein-disulfide isomerase